MKINNRRKIEKFCNDNNIQINHLEFIRCREYIYGDSVDNSHWELSCKINEESFYFSEPGWDVNDGVDKILEDITYWKYELSKQTKKENRNED